MLKAISFLKPYKKQIIVALVLMLIELIVELWLPLLMAKMINEGITEKDSAVVLYWGGFMVGLAFIGFIAGIINSFFSAYVSQNFGLDIRRSLFEKIQLFSFVNHHQFPTSTLITRVTSDVTQLQNVVFMGLRIMMRAPLLLVGGLVMAFIVNVKLAFILAVLTPLLLGLLVWAMNKSFKLFHAVRERLDRVNGVLRENLIGMRLIRVFVRAEHEIARFKKANTELMEQTVTALRLMEIVSPLIMLLMNGGLVAILWFGNLQVNSNQMNIGEIVAIVNYAARITVAFSVVSMIFAHFSRAKASAQRIEEVLETTVTMTDMEDANSNFVTEGKVVFDQVSFQYPGTAIPVLESVSFTIPPGQTLAILGETGSGKSTLFQLILRFYDVDAGSIQLDNTDIRSVGQEALRNGIGYVPQETILFTGTILENIVWGKSDASMEEVIAAAKQAQIHETIMKLPDQYETIIGPGGINLSGGQRQRLSIARALIRKAKLLLLDDSTSALDAKTEAELLNALKTYAGTTLLITQKISTAKQADLIILLEEGKKIAEGNHTTLLKTSTYYRQIVQSQLEEELMFDEIK